MALSPSSPLSSPLKCEEDSSPSHTQAGGSQRSNTNLMVFAAVICFSENQKEAETKTKQPKGQRFRFKTGNRDGNERRAGLWSTGETPQPVEAPSPRTAGGAHAEEGIKSEPGPHPSPAELFHSSGTCPPSWVARARCNVAIMCDQGGPMRVVLRRWGRASHSHHGCTPVCWGQGNPHSLLLSGLA